MVSRRRLLAAAGGALVLGGAAAVELAPASVRYRLGLAHSPDHRVPAGHERVTSGTFRSRHMPDPVGWTIALPPAAVPTAVVVCLHGRNNDHRFAFDDIHLHDVAVAANVPLAVAACDGGADTYWHPRRSGADPMAMVFDEFLPLIDQHVGPGAERAVLGWSMGGYGALLFAEQHPEAFGAVVASSAALWTSASQTAPGAFDDAADYARWNVFTGVDRLRALPVHINCGTHDSFLTADQDFAAALSGPHTTVFTAGFHDAPYWRSQAPAQIAAIATALRITP